MKLSLIIITLFITCLFAAQALPPDPELQSAIQTARKFKNLKPRYTLNEITECATDSFVTLAKNWHNLPSIYRQELKPIFLRPGLPGSFFGEIQLSERFTHRTLDSIIRASDRTHRRLKISIPATESRIMSISVPMQWSAPITFRLT